MEKLRFAIIGSGYRSLYYVRIALALPERFELLGMAVRREEKAAQIEKRFGIRTVRDGEELLAETPDFVVVAVDRKSNYGVCSSLIARGFAVLAETPPSDDAGELKSFWALLQEKNGKLQIAEQYFRYPSYAAKISVAASGLLGEIHAVTISALHEYHAFSIIRQLLGNGLCPVTIRAKRYTYPVTETDSRYGMIENGGVKDQDRVIASLEFADGKLAFYDFSGVQYHSWIRARHLNVQGTRGEIDDQTVSWVEEGGHPHSERLLCERREDGKGIDRVLLAGKVLYRNPFPDGLLTEDEAAIATLMSGMEEYLEQDREVYPNVFAFEDAYLTTQLNKALKTGEPALYKPQPWH